MITHVFGREKCPTAAIDPRDVRVEARFWLCMSIAANPSMCKCRRNKHFRAHVCPGGPDLDSQARRLRTSMFENHAQRLTRRATPLKDLRRDGDPKIWSAWCRWSLVGGPVTQRWL
jgi:hypothetical protein